MDFNNLINERLELGNRFLAFMSLNEAFEASTLSKMVYKNDHNMHVIQQCDAIEWSKVKEKDIIPVTNPASIRAIFNGQKTGDTNIDGKVSKHPLYIYTDAKDRISFISSESRISMRGETITNDNPMNVTGNLRYALPEIFDSGLYERRVNMRDDSKTIFDAYGIELSNLFRAEKDEMCTLKARICKIAYMIIQCIANRAQFYGEKDRFYEFKDVLELLSDTIHKEDVYRDETDENGNITEKILVKTKYQAAWEDICSLLGYKYNNEKKSLFYFKTTTNTDTKVNSRDGYDNFMKTCVGTGGSFPITNVKALYSILTPRLLAAIFVAGCVGSDDKKAVEYAENVYTHFVYKDKKGGQDDDSVNSDANYKRPEYTDDDVDYLKSALEKYSSLDTRWSVLTNLSGKSSNTNDFTQVSLTMFPEYIRKCYIIGVKNSADNEVSHDDIRNSNRIGMSKFAPMVGKIGTKAYKEYYGDDYFGDSAVDMRTDLNMLIRQFGDSRKNLSYADVRCIRDVVGYAFEKTYVFKALKNDGRPYISDKDRDILIEFCQQPDPEYKSIPYEDLRSMYKAADALIGDVFSLRLITGHKPKGIEDGKWEKTKKTVASNINFVNKKIEVMKKRYESFIKSVEKQYSAEESKGTSARELNADFSEKHRIATVLATTLSNSDKEAKSSEETKEERLLKSLGILLEGFRDILRTSNAVTDPLVLKFVAGMCATLKAFSSKCDNAEDFGYIVSKLDTKIDLSADSDTIADVKEAFVNLLNTFKKYDISGRNDGENFNYVTANLSRQSLMQSRADKKADKSIGTRLSPEELRKQIAESAKYIQNIVDNSLEDDIDEVKKTYDLFRSRFKGFTDMKLDKTKKGGNIISYIDTEGQEHTKDILDFEEGDILCYDADGIEGDGALSHIYVYCKMTKERANAMLANYIAKYENGRMISVPDPDRPGRRKMVKDTNFDFEKGKAAAEAYYTNDDNIGKGIFLNIESAIESKDVNRPKYNEIKRLNRFKTRAEDILTADISNLKDDISATLNAMTEYSKAISKVINDNFIYGYPTDEQIKAMFGKGMNYEGKARIKKALDAIGYGNADSFTTKSKVNPNVYNILRETISDINNLLDLISDVDETKDAFRNELSMAGDYESNKYGDNPVRKYMIAMSEFWRKSKNFTSDSYKERFDRMLEALKLLSTMSIVPGVTAGVNKEAEGRAPWNSKEDDGVYTQGRISFARMINFSEFDRRTSLSTGDSDNWRGDIDQYLEDDREWITDTMDDGMDFMRDWINGSGRFSVEHDKINEFWTNNDMLSYNAKIINYMNFIMKMIPYMVNYNLRYAVMTYKKLVGWIDRCREITLFEKFGTKAEIVSEINKIIHEMYDYYRKSMILTKLR